MLGDWIFFLDADEVVSDKLKKEVDEMISRNKRSQPYSVDIDEKVGFDIPRANFFLGRFFKKGGQYPDRRIRLFKKGRGRWPCVSVHEQIAVDGKIGHLKNDLLHYSYETWGEYWQKSRDLYISHRRRNQKRKTKCDF